MEVLTPEKLIAEGKLLKELIIPMLTATELRHTAVGEELWQKGEQKGWQKGQRETLQKNLAQVLAIRFQVEQTHFAQIWPNLSLAALESLYEMALTAPDLPTFEQALAKWLS